eukprot:2254260-Rhodomonas_salina.2
MSSHRRACERVRAVLSTCAGSWLELERVVANGGHDARDRIVEALQTDRTRGELCLRLRREASSSRAHHRLANACDCEEDGPGRDREGA